MGVTHWSSSLNRFARCSKRLVYLFHGRRGRKHRQRHHRTMPLWHDPGSAVSACVFNAGGHPVLSRPINREGDVEDQHSRARRRGPASSSYINFSLCCSVSAISWSGSSTGFAISLWAGRQCEWGTQRQESGEFWPLVLWGGTRGSHLQQP
jgi:hypothetical protein